MKKLLVVLGLTFAFLLSFFTNSQELTTNEYKMNTIKIIHVENNEIYRLGYENMANHYLKKSSDGEDLSKIQLSEKDKNIRCRGVIFKDNHFYSISTEDDFDQTIISLKKIDKDLNVVEEKEIFSEPTIGKNKKAEVFFEHNDNGFVLLRSFTKGKNVRLESFIYDFSSEKMHTSKLEFKSKKRLIFLDFDISEELKGALILDADVSIGDLKKKDLKKLESYLVYVEPEKKMTSLKLTKDKDYFERSFNLTFNNENLFIANLNFHNPSNILSGYTIKEYNLENNKDLRVKQDIFFEFDDFTSRKEWGPILGEVQEKYEKEKDRSNTHYEPFAALEITDLIVDSDEVIIIVREIFYVKPPQNNTFNTGISYQYNSSYSTKRYKEFQITKLNLKSKNIQWWNRIYNAPYTNGSLYATQIAHNNMFWKDDRLNSQLRVYFPYIENNKIVLLYPSYADLYDESGGLKTELINQRQFFSFKHTAYGLIGESKIDMETGKIENSLLGGKIDGAGHLFSSKVISLEGFYVTDEKIIIPVENPIKRSSVLVVSKK